MAALNDDRNNRNNEDRCGKCGADIDPTRRVDFTLKDGTRVCDSCFVKGTRSPTHARRNAVQLVGSTHCRLLTWSAGREFTSDSYQGSVLAIQICKFLHSNSVRRCHLLRRRP